MTDSPLINDDTAVEKQLPKTRRWLWVIILLIVIGLVIMAVLFKFSIGGGSYAIENVVLSSDLRNYQPVDVKDVFRPSDTIICTVTTSGTDVGIIGMRWYMGNQLIYEHIGKTENHTISTYIQSNRSAILTEGDYHVDIFVTDKPVRTVNFKVKIYNPVVEPPVQIPDGHTSIEIPWYPRVPFAFDEVWEIDNTEWKVNEVEVVFIDDVQENFVAVVVDTQLDIASLTKSTAKEITRPIALYALENGYVEKARSLQIDGKYYDLDKYVFVILINQADPHGNRVQFTMDELK